MVKYQLGYVKGADGNGIVSVVKTATSGLVDTYTITFSDGSTTTFQVRNGEDGSAITIDSALSSSSTNPVQNKVINSALNGKSDTGHTHTKSNITDFAHTHDDRYYTESEVDSALANKSDTSHNHDSRYYTESEIDTALGGKANSSHTHTESDISDLGDYIEKSSTSGLVKNDGSIDTNTYLTTHQDITGKCDKSNGANQLTDSSAYSDLGTSANATQKTINSAINTKIGDIEDLIGDAITYINGSGS